MIAKTAHFSHRRALVIFCLFAVLGFGFFNSSVTSVSAQGGGVRINPGDNIQSVINRYPAGTLFTIAAGVHRMQTIAPRNGDVFVGENGAVLNGSRLLTNFQQRNGYWVATGQTQQGSRVGECASGYPRCTYPEDLFINNEPLQHVGSLSEVSSGRWYFDYNTDEVFFADDPTGKTVEISVTPLAFTGSGRGVTVRNLTIEKYATPAQSAALTTGGEWVVDNVTAQLNHGTGIKLRGTNVVLMNSRIFRNGQAGIHTFQADGSVINGNEIAYNHYAHFSPTWAASGGSKFARTNGLTVRNNYVHHNDGPGLWTDIDNNNIVYENNLVVYNTEEGIYHEISYNAVIRNNVVMFNGRVSSTYLMYGSQIFISASGAVEVYNNRVVVGERGNGIGIQQQQRGDGILGDWLARGNFVHSNVIVHTARAGQAGVMLEPEWPNSRSTFWSTFNNRFDRNAYYVSSANAAYTYWRWNDQRLSWSGIRAAGQEINGQLITDGFGSLTSIPAWNRSAPLPIGYPGANPQPQPTVTTAAPTNTPRPTIVATTPAPTALPTEPATPAPVTGPALTSFTLVSADTQQDIRTLVHGETINLATLPTQRINIRANTSPGTVGSVYMTLNSEARTENVAPYVLWGDDDGAYLPGQLRVGTYTLTGKAYSLSQRQGIEGQLLTVAFRVINSTTSATATPRPTIAPTNTPRPTTVATNVAPTNTPRPTIAPTNTPRPTTAPTSVPATPAPSTGGPTVTRLMLVDAITSRDLQVINNGDVINLAALPNRYVSIRIDTVGTVESIRIRFGSRERVENGSPFHLWGDDNGDPVDWGAQPGAYTM
ncbi:MAG: right-handed parallel beta-helix repeat-containing protein, partial [bacterium]|nr:right-handed parallel beta-helix repeat-containing protein [bacterium]